jgi:hypothetical protein
MATYMARIERSRRQPIGHVEIEVTITDLSAGRQTWSGEFTSRSADGIIPDEWLSLTFDSGQKGTARVSETRFDSRNPETTRVVLAGNGPLT